MNLLSKAHEQRKEVSMLELRKTVFSFLDHALREGDEYLLNTEAVVLHSQIHPLLDREVAAFVEQWKSEMERGV